jgi:prevent-host-death family protein
MTQVNIYQAKTTLSRLIEQALAGEDVVIARAGKPLVRLVPYADQPLKRRKPGGATVWIADDFDAPLDGEMGAAFRGELP